MVMEGSERIQRADEWRRPVPSQVAVVDAATGQVVQHVAVAAPHRLPTGYDAEGVPAPPVPDGYQMQPPPPGAPGDAFVPGNVFDPAAFQAAGFALPPTQFAQQPAARPAPVMPQFAPPQNPVPIGQAATITAEVSQPIPVPPFMVATPQEQAARIPALFEIKFGDESEEFEADYANVLIEEDLMVFVAREGERLWLPKASQSAEIALRINHNAVANKVFKIQVLPIRFKHAGWQYGLAMVQEAAQIS